MLHKRMRLCGVLLVWGLLFCCGLTFAAEDAVNVESWIDHAADGFAGGAGSEDDPYLIATAEQLAYLAKTVNEGNFYEGTHFLLVADIDLAGKNWVPIGTQMERETAKDYEYPVDSTVGFGGNLDGGGKTIANATIPEGFLLGGLFGKIHKGNIQNLSVSNINVGTSYFAGGIAGRTYLATIKNCSLEGDIHAALYGGGLVGYSVTTTIITCKAKTTIGWSFDFDEKYYPPASMGERARYTIHGDTHSPHDTPAAGGIVGNAYIGTFILKGLD